MKFEQKLRAYKPITEHLLEQINIKYAQIRSVFL